MYSGSGDLPIGQEIILKYLPENCRAYFKVKQILDNNAHVIGIQVNLKAPTSVPENIMWDEFEGFVCIDNTGQMNSEDNSFLYLNLPPKTVTVFGLIYENLNKIKCELEKSWLKLYLVEPIDIITPPAPGKCKFVKDGKEVRIMFHPGSFSKAIDRLME